jgi:chorismate mutase/prephenate dehydratase
MVKLESRPTKSENWSYFFIMDIEGHLDDPKIKEILSVMKHLCLFMKVLGSYPIDEKGLKKI